MQTGIRSIKVVDGHLMLNGKPLNFRGFGTHEDSLDKGFAIDNAEPRAADDVGAGGRRDAVAQPLPVAPLLLRAPR